MTENSIKCGWCEKDIIGESFGSHYGLICSDCHSFMDPCHDCDEQYHEDALLDIVDVDYLICESCYIDGDYFRCDSCHCIFTGSPNEDGLCDSCEEDQMDEIQYRNIDLKTKSFQSKTEGKIIKSSRTFGVELEMVGKEARDLAKLSRELSKQTGVGRDGSIQGGFGIEVQTPILSGSVGESTLESICKISRSCGFDVNQTCGMHVHLGAKDFLPTYEVEYDYHITKGDGIGAVAAMIVESGNEFDVMVAGYFGSYKAFKINGVEYDDFYSGIPMLTFDHQGLVDTTTSDEREKKILRQFMRLLIINFPTSANSSGITVETFKKNTFLYIFSKTQTPERSLDVINAVKSTGKKETLFYVREIHIEKTSNTEKIKTLMAFYTVFDDVFLSMLSESRRANRFCKPVKERYSIGEICYVRTFRDFEKLWYKLNTNDRGTNGGRDRDRIEERKLDRHDSSRYLGVNFHALLHQNSTIEIRYHGGTLDSNKILSWVSLHQKIFDLVSSGEITLNDVINANTKIRFENKLKEFFKLLKPSDELRSYVEGRINTYGN